MLKNIQPRRQSRVDQQTNPSYHPSHQPSASLLPQKRINIFFILDFVYGIAGTERHLLQLIEHLDRNRFVCTVCTLFQTHPRMLQAFDALGCKNFHLGLERNYDWHAMKQLHRLAKFMKEREIDIVQTFHFGADTYGTLAAQLSGVPIVISSRRDIGYYRYRSSHRRLASRFAMKFSNQLISACDAIKTEAIKHEKISPEKITTIYNGVDLERLTPVEPYVQQQWRDRFGIPRDAFVIGNVSHFRPEKGHQYFFEAIEKIRSQIAPLKVLAVGAPETGSDLTFEQIRDMSALGNDLILPGCVDNVRDYLSVMDVACFAPVENEGFSNALLEKMACGKAIVATDIGGNAEAIEHGVSGYIVPPRDVEALAKVLVRFYKNPFLRQFMGEQARLRVEKDFTIPRMIHEMEKFYLTRLNGNHHAQETEHYSDLDRYSASGSPVVLRLSPANESESR